MANTSTGIDIEFFPNDMDPNVDILGRVIKTILNSVHLVIRWQRQNVFFVIEIGFWMFDNIFVTVPFESK